jgi:undecaprenyl diphosphate synthase
MSNQMDDENSSTPGEDTYSGLKHLALIMDGNRRWAKSQNLTPSQGHSAGFDNFESLVKDVFSMNIPFLSAYAFSAQNWNRSKAEVSFLMKLFENKLISATKEYIKQDIRIRFIGRKYNFSKSLQNKMANIENDSKHLNKHNLCILIDYGGQEEIVDAINNIISSDSKIKKVTIDDINSHLYAPDIPPPDLIVRTSGERRLSNFWLWQSSYAELYFTPTLFPALRISEIKEICDDYEKRNRRFGV